ncbi:MULTISPECIES: PepSY domain-containing protein [Aureimonas]|uniref:PepSY domain-containing protein n=1 Tax=Aureimonas TaxID=414371 RepID=UPI000734DD07|nr:MULTISPECIES: PepSY domain-containing protein [Aureimonas]
MIRRNITLALAAVALLGTAAPTLAQGIEIGRDGVRLVDPNQQQQRDMRRDDRRGREIGERDAVRIARSEGVREVDDVTRMRNSFRVMGTDRSGDDIQVDIDRRTGEVLSVR